MWLTKKIRFVLAILVLTLPLFGRSYTTSFASPPAPENPISEGSNWINGKATGLDWNNIKSTAGFAQTAQTLSASGFDDGTALVTGTWGPDQTVQVTAKGPSTTGGVQEVEIRLRGTMTALAPDMKSTGLVAVLRLFVGMVRMAGLLLFIHRPLA